MILGLAENSIQLVPDGTLVLHVLLIVLMVAVLNKTLFSPINGILAERDRRSKVRLQETRRLLATIGGHVAQYEDALRVARAEGYRLMELERREETREREVQLAKIRDEIVTMLGVEKNLIETQVEEASRTLEGYAQRLGLEIGAQILGRPVQPESKTNLGGA